MEIQVILSILKQLKVAHFEEKANGSLLGNLVYQDYTFSVILYRDSVCQYICLEYPFNDVKNIKDSQLKHAILDIAELNERKNDEKKHS